MLLYLNRNVGLVHCAFVQLQVMASISPLVSHFMSMEAPEKCKETNAGLGTSFRALEVNNFHYIFEDAQSCR